MNAFYFLMSERLTLFLNSNVSKYTNSHSENISGFCAFCTTQSSKLSGIRFSLFIVYFSVFYLSATKQKFLDIEMYRETQA